MNSSNFSTGNKELRNGQIPALELVAERVWSRVIGF